MGTVADFINRLFGETEDPEIKSWRENNPEGFQAALKEERDEYLHVVDAVRHEQGLEPLNEQQRDEYYTPENPYKIQEMHANAIERLGDDGREWLNSQRMVADNLGLVACMQEIGSDEFTDPSAIDDAITGTKIMCDKYGIDPVEVAERYEIELHPEVLEKLTGAAQEADNTMAQNMAPPEYVADIGGPPTMGGMG